MRTFEELEEVVHSINEMEQIFKGIAIEAAHMEEIQRFTELTDRTKEILVKDVHRNDGEESELLEEHEHWAKITGRILVEAVQGEFEYLKVIALNSKIVYKNGEPYLKSDIQDGKEE